MSRLSKRCVKWACAHRLSIHGERTMFEIVGSMLITMGLTAPLL